jgi:hypothetical protein
MHETIENLKRMPGYKNKVWEKVMTMHNQYEEDKGIQGIIAGELDRKRLYLK